MIELLEKIGIIPERIDLGGGLFGKMTDTMKSQFNTAIPSYEDYASVVAKMFTERFGENGPELVIEPGTALVGDCMKFIGVVKSIKNVRGKWIASILGSQKNINMNGINPPIEIIHDSDITNEYVNMDLVGYTCIEGDVLYRNYSGKLAVNDVIIISNCGSYSLVMKPPFILPNFPVIDISEGKIEIIKRLEKFEDIFQTYIF
jgi:diaminopimelate decarboxylase